MLGGVSLTRSSRPFAGEPASLGSTLESFNSDRETDHSRALRDEPRPRIVRGGKTSEGDVRDGYRSARRNLERLWEKQNEGEPSSQDQGLGGARAR